MTEKALEPGQVSRRHDAVEGRAGDRWPCFLINSNVARG